MPSLAIAEACWWCTDRRYQSQLGDLPDSPADLSPFTPKYEEHHGWQIDLCEAQYWGDLPPKAQNFVHRVEALANLKVRLISIGPEREQVIRRDRV